MVKRLLVHLDSQKVYVVPAEVSGTVEVVTDEAKSISVTLKVYAHVSWSEGSGDDSTSYSSREDYLDEEVVLWKCHEKFYPPAKYYPRINFGNIPDCEKLSYPAIFLSHTYSGVEFSRF